MTRTIGRTRWINQQGKIITAIILQDTRTRFGRSYASYIIAVGWPLSHIAFLLGGYLIVNHVAPVGDDPAMFLSTGIIPYILCLYPARMMALVVPQNRQLLNIPILQPIHLIVSRLILEIITALITLLIFFLILYIADKEIIPQNIGTAAVALAAILYFACCLGIINVVLSVILGQFYLIAFVIIIVLSYGLSGVYVPYWYFPSPIRDVMLSNPMLHLVQWLRSAYYASYDPDLVNKPLVLGTATVALFLGLLGERFLRNKFYVA